MFEVGQSSSFFFFSILFLFWSFLIDVQLIYNVLASAVQQSDLAIHINSFPLWFITEY